MENILKISESDLDILGLFFASMEDDLNVLFQNYVPQVAALIRKKYEGIIPSNADALKPIVETIAIRQMSPNERVVNFLGHLFNPRRKTPNSLTHQNEFLEKLLDALKGPQSVFDKADQQLFGRPMTEKSVIDLRRPKSKADGLFTP